MNNVIAFQDSGESTGFARLITDDANGQYVDARTLHGALEIGRDFATWIKDRIEKYGFLEGADYAVSQSPNLGIGDDGHTGGKPTIDYRLSLSMAKELAMVENNDRGREVRQYLIKVEEAWNTPELIIARALQKANDLIVAQRSRIAELKPKADFFDQVASSQTAISMRQVAAALNLPGWGRNKLFAFLRVNGVLDENNLPYRDFQDRGYFRVIEQKWATPGGEVHVNLTTLVYQRGVDFIRKMITRAGAEVTA